MSEYLKKAIEEMEKKLQEHMNEVAETKKAINLLCRQLGEPPRFEDVLAESVKGSAYIKPDHFFNKPLATAVREYLQLRGNAATVDEIYEALEKGGFEFVGKSEGIKKRGLQISLSKSRKHFAYLKVSDTFGLWDFYGGRPKEKDETDKDIESENDGVKPKSGNGE
jgi:hypothetical protein